jgi:hypothetical protein
MAALRDAGLRMSLSALQRNVIPDALLRWGVRKLLEGRLREITRPTLEAQMQELLAFVQCTSQCRVGSVEADANRGAHRGRKRAALRGSHGVLPTSFRKAPQIQVRPSVRPISLRSPTPLPSNNWLEKSSNSVFFSVCSSAYFPKKSSSLDEAEEAMFALYAERAQLQDGQSVLDVGCGWGSLSMYIAEKYPNSTVTGVSNSDTQKAFIAEECR